ncbi:MAG TPA: UvrD-helicase domain-containing protein [Candidatus Glassbacteria bacterium]|nr:UvrD-helicase domain-containing protein [Candidatus Glassbacteria bacterium]
MLNKQASAPLCPNCNIEMVKRNNKKTGYPFWGCVNFRKGCRANYSYSYGKKMIAKVEMDYSKFIPSSMQLAIKDSFVNTGLNIQIRASAGTGKTVTMAWLLQFAKEYSNIACMAFNTHSADDFETKIPAYATSGTTHRFALKNFNGVDIDEDKVKKEIDLYFHEEVDSLKASNRELWDRLDAQKSAMAKLVGLIKNTLTFPAEENLQKLAEKYNVEYEPKDAEWFFGTVMYIFDMGLPETVSDIHVIDLDDMIYLCAIGIVPCRQYDLIILDEAQDTNDMTMEFIRLSLKPDGRIIMVGDENQSIYAFRGANTDAMDVLEKMFSSKKLPLSISYRQPKAGVQFVNKLFPDIEHYAAENAIEGAVHENFDYEKFLPEIMSILENSATKNEENLALCRNNAPLVKPVFQLIRNGIKAVIKGKDIGTQLRNKIVYISNKYHCETIGDFFSAVELYETDQIAKYTRQKAKQSAFEKLSDDCETLLALADDCEQINDIFRKIDKIFSDKTNKAVVFSSIHKAKGLEADNVFIIRPDLMPSSMASTEEEIKQERNAMFVAYTRQKKNLYILVENKKE